MKNIFGRLTLMLLSLTMFAACQEDEGTDPGHDSTPVATVYEYTAGDGYNADNDCRFRVITNSAVQEVYYLAQLNDEKKALSMTDQGSTYDASTKTFTFNFKFTVSAGSFGTAPETLTLDK